MTEVRQLTELEFNQLIKEAPESEIKFMSKLVCPYEWIKAHALDDKGLIIDGKPIYFGAIVKNRLDRFTLWTVVNSDVKEQFTLYKEAKRCLMNWLTKYKEIFATMYKGCEKSLRWTQRMGFIIIDDGIDTITLKLAKGG